MNEDIYSMLDMYDRMIADQADGFDIDECAARCADAVTVIAVDSGIDEVIEHIKDKIRLCNKNKEWVHHKTEIMFLKALKSRLTDKRSEKG